MRFHVYIVADDGIHEYDAIAAHVVDLNLDAIDRFGLCKFSARRA